MPKRVQHDMIGSMETHNGLLLIDKPTDITSFDIIRRLRKSTGVRKIGHTGTLDPMATGLMLMLFGSYTKKAPEFVGLDKVYEAEMTLGAVSTTGDAEGEITAVSDNQPSQGAIELAAAQFVGEIRQTPSKYSAIKIGGVEAYKLARRGQSFHMPSRNVFVHKLQVTSYKYPVVRFTAHVSSGTYIRTLAEDIGESLKVGAYLSNLRRTKIGDFDVKNAQNLPDMTTVSLPDHLLTI
ncbi:MAG TPA: tRNA pseudouridine(55) synthase TruB [Candidatus Saccharimonadales bacterium]|nr:tRNA pseudouridine(55) synthase TruB [Candidatus Saccharimonadales bacterium]